MSQTLILTRYAARTKMPEGESLGDLARHRATLAIHLGVAHLAKIVEELLPHYGADCPVAVIHRASWPDQEQVRGTLGDILPKVAARNFRRTALILVGEVLAPKASPTLRCTAPSIDISIDPANEPPSLGSAPTTGSTPRLVTRLATAGRHG